MKKCIWFLCGFVIGLIVLRKKEIPVATEASKNDIDFLTSFYLRERKKGLKAIKL